MNETPKPPENGPDIEVENLRPHVFDGIQEYDKKLPNWWLMTLYGSIVFSVIYWFVYHTFEVGMTPSEMLAQREAQAAEYLIESGLGAADNESLFQMALQPTVVDAGRDHFTTHCAACHGADGGGTTGFPSLIDDEWDYGGEPMDIREVVLDGAPNGMPAWRSSLGERGVAEVTAYVISINPTLMAQAEEGGE